MNRELKKIKSSLTSFSFFSLKPIWKIWIKVGKNKMLFKEVVLKKGNESKFKIFRYKDFVISFFSKESKQSRALKYNQLKIIWNCLSKIKVFFFKNTFSNKKLIFIHLPNLFFIN